MHAWNCQLHFALACAMYIGCCFFISIIIETFIQMRAWPWIKCSYEKMKIYRTGLGSFISFVVFRHSKIRFVERLDIVFGLQENVIIIAFDIIFMHIFFFSLFLLSSFSMEVEVEVSFWPATCILFARWPIKVNQCASVFLRLNWH